MVQILDSVFSRGYSSLEELPVELIPEIAFVGRSNVGKSSLLNRITQRKKLAHTSATPGKTQELNYYTITIRPESGEPLKLNFVDLPGFGYAKFSKKKREYLSRLTVDYIEQREQLKAICLLTDCRRKPEEDELAVRDLAFSAGVTPLVVVTKLDKIKRSQHSKEVKRIGDAYSLESSNLICSGEKHPINLVWDRILPLVR